MAQASGFVAHAKGGRPAPGPGGAPGPDPDLGHPGHMFLCSIKRMMQHNAGVLVLISMFLWSCPDGNLPASFSDFE